MSSIFSRIIAGEIPCHKIAEDENHLAFLDIHAIAKGHTLVVPKREVDYIYSLSDNELGALHVFAKKIALALQKAVACKRIGITVIGLEVPHAHIHLIPINHLYDMDFAKPRIPFSPEAFAELAKLISSNLPG